MTNAALRAIGVLGADQDTTDPVRDTLLLNHDECRQPLGTFKGLHGTMITLALPQGQRLRPDDRLVLEDGSLIEIVGRPESLLEVRAADLSALARLAWLLGDHHIPVEIHERRLRLRRTDAVRALLEPSSARFIDIEAPFAPEGGAYEGHAHP